MASISALIKISDGFSTPLQNFASKLARAGSAVTGLKGKLGGFGNLKPPTPDFDRFNNTLSQTSGMFSKLVGANVVGGVLTSGIHAATGALGGMLGELNESSTAWQTFNGNMQMVGMNSKQIASARNDMQQFAQQTIYSSSDMASTYAQFAAVGVKDAGKLVKGFGGLAAAATNPQQAMKTLSEQSVQAAAKPKVQWADFRLMMEQTPAGIAQVAKTMGMSMKDLITDVQAGKVKTQDFFNAIAKTGTNKQFTKMATQYKTVGQAMDGLKETLANKMQPAFDKVSKVGIKAVSGLVDAIGNVNFNSMANKIAPVAQSIMNTITSVVQYVSGAFQRFWAGVVDSGAVSAVGSAFSSISSSIGQVFSALGKGGGDPFGMFRNIGSAIGGAVAGAARLIAALAKAVASLPPGVITALAGAFIALKFGMRGLVFTAIIAGLKGLSKLSPGQLKLLAGAITVLAGSLVALKAAQKIKGGLDFLKGLKKPKTPETPKAPSTPKVPTTPNVPDPSPLAPKWLQLGAVLLMVGGAVLLVAGGFYIMAQAAINLANSGGAAIAIFFGFIVALGILIAVVSAFGPALIVGAVGLLIFGAAMLLIGIATFIAAAGLTMLATQLPIIAQYGAMAALNILLLGVAIAVFGALAIVGAIGLIALSVALVVAGVAMIVAAVGAVLLGAAAFVLAAGIMAVAVACMLLGAALMVVAMGFQMLITVVASAINGMVNAVRNGFSSVISAARSGIQGAVSAVSGMVGSFVSAGANLMHGLAQGILSAGQAALDAAGRIASGIASKVKGFFGIHSPSRMFAGFGRYLDAGLEIGINSHMNRPINTAGDMANGVADAMNPLQNGFNVGMNLPSTPQAPVTNTASPASDVPTSTPFSNGYGGVQNTSTTNNNPNTNHIDRSVHIEQGAIVVNGGTSNDETGESIVRKLETFLKNKQNGGMGYGYN